MVRARPEEPIAIIPPNPTLIFRLYIASVIRLMLRLSSHFVSFATMLVDARRWFACIVACPSQKLLHMDNDTLNIMMALEIRLGLDTGEMVKWIQINLRNRGYPSISRN